MLKNTLTAAILVGLLVGCGRKPEEDEAKGAGDLDADKGRPAFSLMQDPGDSDSAAVVLSGTETTELPVHFPEDVPVFEGSKVVHVAGERSQLAVNFTAASSVREISTYYRRNLREKGWKVDIPVDSPVQAILTAAKEGRLLSVAIASADNHTEIELAVSRE